MKLRGLILEICVSLMLEEVISVKKLKIRPIGLLWSQQPKKFRYKISKIIMKQLGNKNTILFKYIFFRGFPEVSGSGVIGVMHWNLSFFNLLLIVCTLVNHICVELRNNVCTLTTFYSLTQDDSQYVSTYLSTFRSWPKLYSSSLIFSVNRLFWFWWRSSNVLW